MPKYTPNMREEEIKNRLRDDYFKDYDPNPILGNVDFAVAVPTPAGQLQLFETEYLLWAEAKEGTGHDLYESLTQLILTIGKEGTNRNNLPPAFLGAFDREKIIFIAYYKAMHLFAHPSTTTGTTWWSDATCSCPKTCASAKARSSRRHSGLTSPKST